MLRCLPVILILAVGCEKSASSTPAAATPDPTCDGKPLSEWVRLLADANPRVQIVAAEAVLQIGDRAAHKAGEIEAAAIDQRTPPGARLYLFYWLHKYDPPAIQRNAKAVREAANMAGKWSQEDAQIARELLAGAK